MTISPDYSISTPENVDLHLELAGLGNRIWAAFIDTLIVDLILTAVIIVTILAGVGVQYLPAPENTKSIFSFVLIAIAILLCFALQFGYFIYFEKTWQGQTPGKKVAQIRVIESNGQPVNWASVIIRNLIRIVDTGLLMVGVVVMILDKNERRLGDLLGGTLVIKERQPQLSLANLKITSEAPETSFVDSGQISPDEYHLLTSFLRRRHELNQASRSKLAKELEEYFRLKLNPENKNEGSEVFLEKVYLSYSSRAQLEKS